MFCISTSLTDRRGFSLRKIFGVPPLAQALEDPDTPGQTVFERFDKWPRPSGAWSGRWCNTC